MSRSTRERAKVAAERWPNLGNLVGSYLNEDFALLHGSLAGALSAAARDGTLAYRQQVLKEWRDWNATEGAVADPRPFLRDGFQVAVQLPEPIDARKLMNRLYDELIVQVRAETAGDRT
jgi:hypothetical protein